jgi:hypothetical protein
MVEFAEKLEAKVQVAAVLGTLRNRDKLSLWGDSCAIIIRLLLRNQAFVRNFDNQNEEQDPVAARPLRIHAPRRGKGR